MVSEVFQVGKNVKNIKVGDRVYPWEQLPQAIEKASKVEEALNVVIKY